MLLASSLVEHARLVSGHHVLDVDEGVLAARLLEDLQGLLDEVSDVGVLLLRVVDAVALVYCRSTKRVRGVRLGPRG